MARTTLRLDDDLLKRLKETAARQGRTLQSLANDLLRSGLVRTSSDGQLEYELRLEGWEAEEQAGVDILDRDKLFDVMDGR